MLTPYSLFPPVQAKSAPAARLEAKRPDYVEAAERRTVAFAEAPDRGDRSAREAPDAGLARSGDGHGGFTHGRSWS